MLSICAVPFLTSYCLKRFLKYLPEDAQKILEYVVLEGPVGNKEVERVFGIKGSIKSAKPNWQGQYQEFPSPELRFYISHNRNPYYYSYYGPADIIYALPNTVRALILSLLFTELPAISTYTPLPSLLKKR